MTSIIALSRLTSATVVAAVLATAVMRALGLDGWRTALGVAVLAIGARVLVTGWRVVRGELAWSRLLLPAIILLEGVGMWWSGAPLLWEVRVATLVMLEITFVIIAIRALRRTRAGDMPVEVRIAQAFTAQLPPLAARLVAFELVIVGSALRFLGGGWRRALPAGFTYHRDSGLRMLLPALPLLAVGDILLFELLVLPHAAVWVRVVVHVVGVYGLVWLVGFYASMRARPHQLVDGVLVLHRGMLARLSIPVEDITSIAPLPSFSDDWKRRAYGKGALRMDVAGPAVLELVLRTPARAMRTLGSSAPSTRIFIAVDDPAAFTAAVAPRAP